MIDAGRVVTCPKCGRHLLRTRRAITIGDLLAADLFETFEAVPQPVDGESVVECCGVHPIRPILSLLGCVGFEIHLKEGWVGR